MVLAVTASSDGKIRLFDVTTLINGTADSAEAVELEAIGAHDTGGARLTCLDVVGGGTAAALDLAAIEQQDEEEDEDDSIDY